MSGNRSFERSMNGINNIEVSEVEFPDGSTISSAANLVQLDTNNNFTSFNTFNINLPTSSVDTALVNINDNTILNKFAGDKLYPASTDVDECFDGVSINNRTLTFSRVDNANPEDIVIPETDLTAVSEAFDDVTINNRTLTFSRVDNANPEDIVIPETDLTNVVLKSTAQTITDVKTFNDFPIKSGTGTDLNPTNDNQLTTKKYVDDNAGTGDAVLSGTNAFTGTNTFNTNRPSSSIVAGAGLVAGDFITKNDGDTLYQPAGGGGSSFKGFQYQQTSTSATAVYPWIFSGLANPPFVNVGNSYNPLTGFFDAVADDVGYWFFYLNVTVVSGAVQIPTPAILITRSGTTTDMVRAFDNQGFQRGGPTAYGTTNISSMVEVRLGDRIFAINGHNAVSSYFANQYTNFGGYKIG